MPISRPRRSIHRSPTNTCDRCTKKRTPARADRSAETSIRRLLARAALLLFAAASLFAGCDDDDRSSKATSTPSSPQSTATSTGGAQSDDLRSAIYPRGDVPAADPIALAQRYGLTDG